MRIGRSPTTAAVARGYFGTVRRKKPLWGLFAAFALGFPFAQALKQLVSRKGLFAKLPVISGNSPVTGLFARLVVVAWSPDALLAAFFREWGVGSGEQGLLFEGWR